MKILHVAETFKGGVATVVNSLATFQLEDNRISQVKLIIPEEHSLQLSDKLYDNYTTFKRKKRGIGSLINLAHTIYKTIKEYNPDIVHLHSTFSGGVGRLILLSFFRGKNIKVIYCPHAFPFLMNSNKYKKKVYVTCEKMLAKCTDKIICVGKSEFDSAITVGMPASKMTIINNGVDIPNRQNNRRINNLDEYVLLYVGRFDFQKGTDILIDALKKIDNNKLKYKIKMIIVGEGVNESTDYQSLTFKHINVEFTGWIKQEHLFDYYINSDCLIIPSRWEGLAMVPLEAISYKLPVITSDISAFKEINAVSGLHFKNADSLSLANVLTNLNSYDLDKIKSELFEKICAENSQFLMNEKTISLYEYLNQGGQK